MGRKTKKTAKGQAPPTHSDKAPLTQSDKAPPTQAEPAQGPEQGNVNTSAAVPELSKSARKEVAELITSLLEGRVEMFPRHDLFTVSFLNLHCGLTLIM